MSRAVRWLGTRALPVRLEPRAILSADAGPVVDSQVAPRWLGRLSRSCFSTPRSRSKTSGRRRRFAGATPLSIELALCVLLLAIAHRVAGTLAGRCCQRYGLSWSLDIISTRPPRACGREFNLYWDSQHLGNVTAMLARAAPIWLIALAAMSLIAAIVLMFLLARLALRWLASAMEWPIARRVLHGSGRARS